MPLLHEVRVLLEVDVFVVLQHKHAIVGKQPIVEHKADQLVVMLAIVRRIGKDKVVFCLMVGEKAEHVGAHGKKFVHAEFECRFADELDTAEIKVDRGHLGAAARDKLIGDVAGAGKKVERVDALKIHVVFQNVEQTLLGHVGGGPDREVVGRYDLTPLVSASYNAHDRD